eukprot:scaffold14362_cov142-Isochrysis_galbana.AAC.2
MPARVQLASAGRTCRDPTAMPRERSDSTSSTASRQAPADAHTSSTAETQCESAAGTSLSPALLALDSLPPGAERTSPACGGASARWSGCSVASPRPAGASAISLNKAIASTWRASRRWATMAAHKHVASRQRPEAAQARIAVVKHCVSAAPLGAPARRRTAVRHPMDSSATHAPSTALSVWGVGCTPLALDSSYSSIEPAQSPTRAAARSAAAIVCAETSSGARSERNRARARACSPRSDSAVMAAAEAHASGRSLNVSSV